jgi:hypothetical protein
MYSSVPKIKCQSAKKVKLLGRQDPSYAVPSTNYTQKRHPSEQCYIRQFRLFSFSKEVLLFSIHHRIGALSKFFLFEKVVGVWTRDSGSRILDGIGNSRSNRS